MKKGRGVGGHVTYVDGGDGSAAVESEAQGRGPRRRGGGSGRRRTGDAAAGCRGSARQQSCRPRTAWRRRRRAVRCPARWGQVGGAVEEVDLSRRPGSGVAAKRG